MIVGAVIVAGGSGTRFGATDKVLAPVAGRPMLVWSLQVFAAAPVVREIVVVTGAHTAAAIGATIDRLALATPVTIVAGGAERAQSVANGVVALGEDVGIAVIHDAARPLCTVTDIEGVVAAAAACGGAIVATPVTDTLKACADGRTISATVDRSTLWAAQTPQAFRRSTLLDAFAHGAAPGITDEAMLFESLGLPVAFVPGRRDNLKVTVPEDLAIVDALMRQRLERVS